MKRFYKLVSTHKIPGGYEIHLDGRAVKTPAKHALIVPSQNLADLVMQEWAAQDKDIRPASMPITQFISTKIDRVATERPAMSAALLKYLDTDMICYHADDPPEVAALQKKIWTPWLEWFSGRFGVVLKTTSGLSALKQDKKAHDAAREFVESLDGDRFTVLAVATPACGSLVLGLAFVEGQISADDLFAAARVEENFKAKLYNEEKYGPDPAQEKKDAATIADLRALEIFLKNLN